MYRFHSWAGGMRPDFWSVFYEHPELLDIFAYIQSVLAAKTGYKFLETYDILEIGEHNPGHTVCWIPITLGTYTYNSGADYPHSFTVDGDWLYIDCLYDTHVDPRIFLQNAVDYKYSKGSISFIKFPEMDKFLVSKGLYAGTRLADDIGTAFGYPRKDSFSYRDNLIPLLAMFYKGPSLHNIIAGLNVMVNNPVSKYSNEIVLSTVDGDVLTNKYRYSLGSGTLAHPIGSVLPQHTAFADVIELYTHKTHPNWWEDRTPELFNKYRIDGSLNYLSRDLLMERFLKYFIAHIRINLVKADWRLFQYDEDVWNLILDASPIRTDYILSMYYQHDDLDLPIPDVDISKLRLGIYGIWGMKDLGLEVDQWLYAPREAKRFIYPSGITDPDWRVGSPRYRILSPNKLFEEFWSQEPNQNSYVEPNIDKWYLRSTKTPGIPTSSIYTTSYEIPNVTHRSVKLGLHPPEKGDIVSFIADTINYTSYSFNQIMAEQILGMSELRTWELYDTAHIGVDGIVVNLDKIGYAISSPIELGGFPKKIEVTINCILAQDTSIKIQYSLDKKTWLDLPRNNVISNVNGKIFFKAIIKASHITSPVLRGLSLSIRT